MANFKTTVDRVTGNGDHFPVIDKQKIFEKSKKYILIQQLLEDIQDFLTEGETIEEYLAFSSVDNISNFSANWMSFSYARTAKAKSYVENFKGTRGNRLFIFTNQRIIYLFPLEFFESNHFYSYPYDSIKVLTLQEHRKKNTKLENFTVLDFESNQRVFTETLNDQDYARILKIRDKVSGFGKIPVNNKPVRKRKFDYLFGHMLFGLKIASVINYIYIMIFILLLVGLFLDGNHSK